MLKNALTSASIALILIALPAQAAETPVPYNTLSFEYRERNLDVVDVDFDVLTFSASYLANENLYLTVTYDEIEDEFDVTRETTLYPGIGYRHDVSETADLIAEVGAVIDDIELQDGSASTDDTGVFFAAGLRARATDMVEMSLRVTRFDIYDNLTTRVNAGLALSVTPKVALLFGIEDFEDTDAISVGVRGTFK